MSYRTSKIYQGPGGGGSSSPVPTGGETAIDITGLSTIDMTGNTNFSVINLTSSNATETINIISNITDLLEREFRPANGLTITWNDKTVAPPVPAPNLKTQAPSVDTLGTQKGYIRFKARVVAGDQYSGLYLDQYP